MKKKLILFISLILIIVIGIFVIAQQGEEPEVTENATYTDYRINTFDLGNGSFAQTSYLGYVNYYNGSEFMPINTTMVESSDPLFDYEVIEGVYQAYFKSDPTWGPVVKFIKDGIEITFQPMALQYEGYYGGLEEIYMVQDVVGAPDGSNFLYKNAYGNGIDLQYTYYNELLKENLIISQSSDLPSPPQYMIDQGNITLNLDFVLETNSNHIVIEGVEWDKSTTKETSNEVYIKNESGNILYYLPKPYAYDSYGSVQLLEYQFKKQGNSLYVTIKTPYSWLSDFSRGYPVYIDPSTGYRSPGTVVNDASYGVVPWLYPDDAKTSNNVYARLPGLRQGATSQYLKATNFGFSVPTGAEIDGILVQFERYPNTAGLVYETEVRIVKADGSFGLDDKQTGLWAAAEAYYSYGGSAASWSEFWTAANINDADFGVVLAIVDDVGGIAYVDHIRITVYYTEPGPSNFYINIGDTWQDAEQIYINIGDVWQDVELVRVNIGDAWQTIFSI